MAERIVVVGGGAAGFFAAIACARARPENEVSILERGSQFLTKVRISGGGRCNVTHALFDAPAFATRYPRGERALLSAFHRFDASATVDWFEQRGVRLKTERDGRMFPTTDSSTTIVQCLMHEAEAAGVKLCARRGVERLDRGDSGQFIVTDDRGDTLVCDRVLLATGGARHAQAARLAQEFGHTIEAPVPSLFSFTTPTEWLRMLPGVSVADAAVSVADTRLHERGPLLITHTGVSGPGILRLSAWGARALQERDYRFLLHINWLPEMLPDAVAAEFASRRNSEPNRRVLHSPIAPLPARLWEQLALSSGVTAETRWTNLSRDQVLRLTSALTRTELVIDGKTLNKDEFVTCGGVRLRELNFKTMESRLVPRLYFAGELLDIDGLTGGFNFQAAWTTGWIAGHAMADRPS